MRALVSGCSGVLGHEIAQLLSLKDVDVTRSARRPFSGDADLRLDLTDEARVREAAQGHEVAILAPILTTSAPAAGWLAEEGVRRIVLFSSNNVGIDPDASVYQRLADAEEVALQIDAEVVILRPTMIYGYPGDGNLSRLLGLAGRFGMLPCPGDGGALQQPVHVTDVAAAAVQAALGTHAPGPFSVGGPEIITSHALFQQVLAAAGRPKERVLPLPLFPLRLVAGVLETLKLPAPVTTAQLKRVSKDKTATEAAPFGYIPQVSLAEGLERLAAALAGQASRG